MSRHSAPRYVLPASPPRPRTLLLSILLLFACAATAGAGTYYVDYDGGSDASTGITTTQPWKHCPGDPAATGVAGAKALGAADTVIFKGGVHYRGNVRVRRSGSAAAPIVLDGNTAGQFGQGRAIIDGSRRITGWTRCQSAAECGGNPNWQSIYVAYAPTGLNPGTANIYQDGKMCWMAQDPNQPDPLLMDNTANFYSVPVGAMTRTSVTDPLRLNQTDPNHWAGAYAMLWVTPNVVAYRKILSFDPAADRITYDQTGAPYTDRNGLYAIYNSLHLLDTPGEYFFDETITPSGLKVYLWPHPTADIAAAEISVSVRSIGVDLGGSEYVTVQGFRIQKQAGAELHNGIGVKALDWNLSPRRLTIRDNEFFGIRHHPSRGYGAVYIYGGSDCLIEGNLVEEMPVNMGFLLGGVRTIVRDNTLKRCGSQTIWFMGARDGQIVNNRVEDGRGTHANGISVYSNSSNVMVSGNVVYDSNISITVESSSDVTLAYNVCVNPGFYVVADWGGCTNLKIHNNTLIRDRDATSITSSSGGDIRNNIGLASASAGSLTPDSRGNLFCTRTQLAQVLENWQTRDLRPRADGPAIDAALSLGYTADVNGTAVPQGGGPDIGAIELEVQRIPGDADGNGAVTLQDFAILKQNFGATGAVWEHGDFDGDGDVDLDDFVILKKHFGA